MSVNKHWKSEKLQKIFEHVGKRLIENETFFQHD